MGYWNTKMATTLQQGCKEHAFVPIFLLLSCLLSIAEMGLNVPRYTLCIIYFSLSRGIDSTQHRRDASGCVKISKRETRAWDTNPKILRPKIGNGIFLTRRWNLGTLRTVCGSFSYVKFNCIRSCETGWQNFRLELRLRRRKRIGRVVWRDSPGNFDKTRQRISWYGWLKTVAFSAWLSRCLERFLRNFQTGDCIVKDYDKRFVQLLLLPTEIDVSLYLARRTLNRSFRITQIKKKIVSCLVTISKKRRQYHPSTSLSTKNYFNARLFNQRYAHQWSLNFTAQRNCNIFTRRSKSRSDAED